MTMPYKKVFSILKTNMNESLALLRFLNHNLFSSAENWCLMFAFMKCIVSRFYYETRAVNISHT